LKRRTRAANGQLSMQHGIECRGRPASLIRFQNAEARDNGIENGLGEPMSNHAYPYQLAERATEVDAGALALLVARLCFASDFLLFGSRKFANPSIIYNLIETHHLPGELVYPTIVLQLGCGLLVLLGLQTRLAAAALAWFCIVAPSIFWLDNLENLSRDYAAAGGLMLLCLFGPGPLSLDARLRNMRDLAATTVPAIVDNALLINRVMLAARALIAFPFLADVVKKLIYFGPQRALMEKSGIPGDAIYLVLLIELVCGAAVLIGYRTRLAAAGLLAWAAVLGFVIHYPGYEFSHASKSLGEVWTANFYNRGAATFFKDITTIGALLMLLVHGPGALSRDARAQPPN
jgi:putative oxidoreductase